MRKLVVALVLAILGGALWLGPSSPPRPHPYVEASDVVERAAGAKFLRHVAIVIEYGGDLPPEVRRFVLTPSIERAAALITEGARGRPLLAAEHGGGAHDAWIAGYLVLGHALARGSAEEAVAVERYADTFAARFGMLGERMGPELAAVARTVAARLR